MPKKIVIYSTPTCPYCKIAKNYFEEKGLEYKDIDVSQDPKAAEEMVHKSGQYGVPFIDIEGQYILGFDQGAIEKALSS